MEEISLKKKQQQFQPGVFAVLTDICIFGLVLFLIPPRLPAEYQP